MKSKKYAELKSAIFLFAVLLSIALNSNAAEPIWDANTITLEKRLLAPGVFGVFSKQTFEEPLTAPKPTSGGFIIGEKGILVVESFLNKN